MNLMRILILVVFLTLSGGSVTLFAEEPQTIAVIGTGRVGSALGPRLATLGFDVVYGSRDPARAEVKALLARSGESARAMQPAAAASVADIIFLAIPWRATLDTIAAFSDLSEKIVVDVTNAIRFGQHGMMEMVVDDSAGEQIQAALPNAKVVKAFNTVGYHVMADPRAAGGPVTIPIVGDDAKAKSQMAEIINDLGFDVADLGPMRHARHLEGMAILYMVPYFSADPADAFEFYLRKGTQPEGDRTVRPAE